MKTLYAGGNRGYQAAIYKPGSGWVGSGRRRAAWSPERSKSTRPLGPAPLAVAVRRSPSWRTRMAIVAVVAAVAALLTLVLTGVAQF